ERFTVPVPTPNDLRLLDAVASAGIDAVALSFVRSAADVTMAKEAAGPSLAVVSKIETQSAVDDIDEIIRASDGVMVARGDLGVRIEAAISAAAWRASHDVDVAAIVCCTRTGATARAISRFRPTAPILAVTPSVRAARQLSLAWGVQVALADEHESTEDIVWFAVQLASHMGLCRAGDIVAVLAGSPTDPEPTTDVL